MSCQGSKTTLWVWGLCVTLTVLLHLQKNAVNIYSPTGTPIITGWRKTTGPRLWCMSIITNRLDMPPLPDVHKNNALQALSEYDLPSVEALIR